MSTVGNSLSRRLSAWRRRKQALRDLDSKTAEQVFTEIYETNAWRGEESLSGRGSDAEQTGAIERELPGLLAELNAASMLDVPCGDFHWMRSVDLGGCSYVGADIVAEAIAQNRCYKSDNVRFVCADMRRDDLPRADVVLVRDALVHFSYEDAFETLKNIGRSGSRFLLITTFAGQITNHDIVTGRWRPLNLEAPPFGFPPPLRLISEMCTQDDESYGDKSLGLWHVKDVCLD